MKLTAVSERMVNSAYQVTQVGYPVSSFYLMHATGVFQTDEEVQNSALQHPRVQPGDLRFEDVVIDNKINADDKKIVGDPWPDFTWGFTNKFSYGNLALSVTLNGSHGADTYFQAGEIVLNSAGVQNQLAIVDRRWKSAQDPGDGFMPRAIRSNHAYAFSSSSHFLFDSSFTRIKNVNLSYKLPGSLVSKLSLVSAAVYIDVNNLHTFTNYPGYDPESSTSGDNVVNAGIDYLTYPLPRTYTFGVQLTF
jgi:hypothetical protein